jgi:hypothetical protein
MCRAFLCVAIRLRGIEHWDGRLIFGAEYIPGGDDDGEYRVLRAPPEHAQDGYRGSLSWSGDCYLRGLLASAAQYVLSPYAPAQRVAPTGLHLAPAGTARAKKRAAVAVVRKLAVLLWLCGE